MTFEEFFKKKKINLILLQSAEPALFAEFEKHYELMGEKSFDHTKKYWFNKLRRLYPLPPEVKAVKIQQENQVAEQTITESLAEEPVIVPAQPRPAFKPRFKAPAPPPSTEIIEQTQSNSAAPVDKHPTEVVTDLPAPGNNDTAPKPAFKPRFKPGITKPAVTADTPGEVNEPAPAEGIKPENKNKTADTETPALNKDLPKPAYKPRFVPRNIKPELPED